MAKKELTQEQRDQKNARLRVARAAAKQGGGIAVVAKRKPVKTVTTNAAPVKVGPSGRKVGSGGARPNTGFQKLPVADKMVIISFRGLPAQKKKFAKLGGGAWARARIDAGTVKG